ncbi:AraC family transcriptional regulator [Pseudomonas anguilliseptica]|uniref:AraC family transcriptional regulator n=1 Tax=Pseudomonas anguilliseptica TaxID=53406 RepID=A0A1H4XG09_PSEAG|nr:AraC family transcriptional regulator [Pseudomonas anguilliseptica]SED04563.1 AraC family transcriptional regulator [Pseudomonas anguilliseptica]
MKVVTRQRYAVALQQVLDWLLAHLDEPMDFYRLADEACLSPFHFHRVYRGLTGETPQDTQRRMRLHRAAVALCGSSQGIARLARTAGYGSVQAFSRAFREAYGEAPTAYRARTQAVAPLTFPPFQEHTNMYQVEIRTLSPQSVAAMAHCGNYQAIGETFERLNAWAAGQGLAVAQSRSFGIYYDDPLSQPVASLRADACIEAPENLMLSAPLRRLQTPGGRCAVLEFVGPYAELDQAYHWLYSQWLPNSGEQPGEAPCFEEYLNDVRSVPPAQLRTAICIPLAG